MNEVFNFQENKSYNLRSGIHLASRNMHTAHFGTYIIFSLGTKQWKIMPHKIIHASTLSAFKTKNDLGLSTTTHVDYAKCLLRFCWSFSQSLNRIHPSAYSFFLKKSRKKIERKLRTLFYAVGLTIHTKNYIIRHLWWSFWENYWWIKPLTDFSKDSPQLFGLSLNINIYNYHHHVYFFIYFNLWFGYVVIHSYIMSNLNKAHLNINMWMKEHTFKP